MKCNAIIFDSRIRHFQLTFYVFHPCFCLNSAQKRLLNVCLHDSYTRRLPLTAVTDRKYEHETPSIDKISKL